MAEGHGKAKLLPSCSQEVEREQESQRACASGRLPFSPFVPSGAPNLLDVAAHIQGRSGNILTDTSRCVLY